MVNREYEHAAMERELGNYRLVELSWLANKENPVRYDYFHGAFECGGEWNVEFFDDNGHAVWVYGHEVNLNFKWEVKKDGKTLSKEFVEKSQKLRLVASDVSLKLVPSGALCQSFEERGNMMPRHWKKWRIV